MQSNNYYYTTDGNAVLGPETLNAIRQMQINGDLGGSVQVACEGTEDWISLEDAIQRVATASKSGRSITNSMPDPRLAITAKETAIRGASVGRSENAASILILLSFLIVVTASGVGLFAWNTFGTKPPKTAPAIINWEYKRVAFPAVNPDLPELPGPGRTDADGMHSTTIKLDEKELDALGGEGWELATSFLEMETAYPNFGKDEYVTGLRENVRPQLLVCIFKRPHYR